MWPLSEVPPSCLPLIGGLVYLIARPIVNAILPPGYYFRFMRKVLTKRNGAGGDDGPAEHRGEELL